MKFQDYYETLGVARTATPDDIKRAYRKLARKYHPDVSKEADAEARFKAVGEAYAVLKDPEKRAAYDQVGADWKGGQDFSPPPGWNPGFEFRGGESATGDGADFSEFFESLFGHQSARPRAHRRTASAGEDSHAKVLVDLEDAYRGARRSLSLRMPSIDAQGNVTMQERTLEVTIPKGIRAGQHLRLAGQGAPGFEGGPAGDLYLEIEFLPHKWFRVDGRDVHLDLPLAPWEAALGAAVNVPTPEGEVQLTIPPRSRAGRKLRLRGKGIPGTPPGDMYAEIAIALPMAESEPAKDAYRAMSTAFADFRPRAHLEG